MRPAQLPEEAIPSTSVSQSTLVLGTNSHPRTSLHTLHTVDENTGKTCATSEDLLSTPGKHERLMDLEKTDAEKPNSLAESSTKENVDLESSSSSTDCYFSAEEKT